MTKKKVLSLALSLLMVLCLIPAGAMTAFALEGISLPTNVRIECVEDDNGAITNVKACWDPVNGADGYHLTIAWNEWDNYAGTKTVTGENAQKGEYDITDIVTTGGGTFSIKVSAYKEPSNGSPGVMTFDVESEELKLYLLTVSAEDGTSVVTILKEDTAIGDAIEAAFLPTLTEENGSYFSVDENGNKNKLIAVTPKWTGSYGSMSAVNSAACWPSGGTGYGNTISEDTCIYTLWENDLCTDGEPHHWEEVIHKASFTDYGYISAECTKCGKVADGIALAGMKVDNVKLAKSSYVYTGKAIKPSVTVENCDGPLDKDYYTLSYANNVNAGTASVTVKLKGKYYEGSKTLKFTITKAASTITLKAKTATYTGKAIGIGAATKTGSTGKVTYTYYTNSACTTKTTKANSGAAATGGAPVNVGTYYVKATVAADANHTAKTSAAVKLVIKKAASTITLKAKTANYTGKAIKIAAATKTGSTGKVTYTYYTNSGCTVKTTKANSGAAATGGAPVNAGTYYVKATVAADANHTAKTSAAVKLVIKKVSNKITASNFTKKKAASAQTFSIGAKRLGGAKLTYKSNNSNITVSAAGKVTIKKNYTGKATITITAAATANYNKTTKNITVTVK